MSLDTLHSIGDRRWDDHLRPLYKARVMDARWLDLRALPPRENVEIYFDSSAPQIRRCKLRSLADKLTPVGTPWRIR